MSAARDPLLSRLTATDDAACLAVLAQLCRRSPRFAHWLAEDFGRDATVRKRFARLVSDEKESPPRRLAEFTDDATAWRTVQRTLRAQLPAKPYGGLAYSEVETLIRQYQAGGIDLGIFLLAQSWDAAGQTSPTSLWAGLHLLETSMPGRQWRMIKQLAKAFTFLRRYENKAKRRNVVGYADWWKVQLLCHLLRHPREAYRTRDLVAYLAGRGIDVSTKDIRRFCTRHRIRRDMRAGRPRTRT